MDIWEYISSGAIESYVMGLDSPEEAAEFERLRAQYPELDKATAEFEEALERQLLSEASVPQAGAKSRLMNTIAALEAGELRQAPVRRIAPVWRMLAAACFVLLATSVVFNVWQYSRFRDTDDKYHALLVSSTSLQANNQVIQARLNVMDERMQLIGDSSVRSIRLNAMPGKGNNNAMVYWNRRTKEVYIASALESAPDDRQYQLWAIVDGKPVDAGMLNDCRDLCHMKDIAGAQAFAITLEKKGGSPVPTMTSLYVMGKI